MEIKIINTCVFDNIYLCNIRYFSKKVLLFKHETIFCKKRYEQYGLSKPKLMSDSKFKRVDFIEIEITKKVGSKAI